MRGLAAEAGWEYGGPHAGHQVGEFPHEKINGDGIGSYIAPGSTEPRGGLSPEQAALMVEAIAVLEKSDS